MKKIGGFIIQQRIQKGRWGKKKKPNQAHQANNSDKKKTEI